MTKIKNSNRFLNIVKIFYAIASDIDYIISYYPGSYRKMIFATGIDWKELDFTPGTAKFQEQSKRVAAGKYYEQKLTFNFPGDSIESYPDMEIIRSNKLIIRFDYEDATSKIIGDKDYRTLLDEDFLADKNTTKNELQFFCNHPDKSYWLEITQ